MTAPSISVCAPWIVGADLVAMQGPIGDVANLDLAIEVASELLFQWSGRLFTGECESTVRPGHTQRPDQPFLADVLHPCFHQGIELPNPPVVSITEVKLDGLVLDASQYRVYDNRTLFRVGGMSWPCWQDLTLDDDAVGAFVVKYKHGIAPPASGRVAVAAFAAQLLKGWANKPCALPERVSQMTRQNLSVIVSDPADFFGQRRTGIAAIDMFLSSYDKSRARSYNPDDIAARKET